MVIFFKTYLLRKSDGDFEETQGFAFINKRTDGEQPDKLLLEKGFPEGTHWL